MTFSCDVRLNTQVMKQIRCWQSLMGFSFLLGRRPYSCVWNYFLNYSTRLFLLSLTKGQKVFSFRFKREIWSELLVFLLDLLFLSILELQRWKLIGNYFDNKSFFFLSFLKQNTVWFKLLKMWRFVIFLCHIWQIIEDLTVLDGYTK